MTVRNFVKTTAEYKKLENLICIFKETNGGFWIIIFAIPFRRIVCDLPSFFLSCFYFGLLENVKETWRWHFIKLI